MHAFFVFDIESEKCNLFSCFSTYTIIFNISNIFSDQNEFQKNIIPKNRQCQSAKTSNTHLINGNLLDMMTQILAYGFGVFNTCGFDAFSELVKSAYGKIDGFRNFINNNTIINDDLNYFNFISLYHKEGPSAKVYELRAKILCRLYEFTPASNNQELDCRIDLHGEVLPMLLTDAFDANQLHVCLPDCKGFEVETIVKTIPINFADPRFTGDSRKILKKAISILMNDTNEYTSQCPRDSKNVRSYCGWISEHFLAFSTYSIHEYPLIDIPPNLDVNGSRYELVGTTPHGSEHYKAYIKVSDSEWIIKDDVQKQVEIISGDSLLSTKTKITVLMYAR